jgi:hypothetical protein
LAKSFIIFTRILITFFKNFFSVFSIFL